MKYITVQIPIPIASKLVDTIQVGAEGLDESDYKHLMKLSQQISEALDNNERLRACWLWGLSRPFTRP